MTTPRIVEIEIIAPESDDQSVQSSDRDVEEPEKKEIRLEGKTRFESEEREENDGDVPGPKERANSFRILASREYRSSIERDLVLSSVRDHRLSYPYKKVTISVLLAASITVLPLALPLAPADAGIVANLVFLCVYNTLAGMAWAGQSYERLRLVFEDAETPYGIPWLAWKLLGGFIFMIVYGAVWCAWNTRVESSYCMIYGVPLAFILEDLNFVTCLKSPTRSSLRYILIHNLICVVPISLIICFIAADGMSNHVSINIIVPLLCLGTTEVVVLLSERLYLLGMDHVQEKNNIENNIDYSTTGYNFLLELNFVFSEILLFASSKDQALTLIMVLICDTIIHFQFLKNYYKVSKTLLLGTPLPSSLWMRLEGQLAMLLGPILFAAALPILLFGGNRRHYYIYECGRKNMLIWILIQVGIKLLWSILLISREWFLLRKARLWALVQATHLRIFVYRTEQTAWTCAFIGVIFTSCWLIKHDGIKILSQLSVCESKQPINTLTFSQ